MSQTDTVCLGDSLLSYTKGDLIGRGGFGLVWKALQTSGSERALVDRSVAVKEIHLRNDDTERLRKHAKGKSILQRWQLLLDLTHPNVLPYYQIKIEKSFYGGTVNLAMEFVEDGDLDGLISQLQKHEITLGNTALLDMTEQLADGLHYLHKKDIIHGDLKPANVLKKRVPYRVTKPKPSYYTGPRREWTLIIADLDDRLQLEENITQSLDSTQIHGTARYMSPEMVARFVKQGNEKPGRKTDVWSLGCIVLDLAGCLYGNGQRSFWKKRLFSSGSFTITEDTTREQIIIMIAKGYVPVVPSKMPRGLADIIKRCLVVNVTDRISADGLKTLTIRYAFTTSNSYVEDYYKKWSPMALPPMMASNRVERSPAG